MSRDFMVLAEVVALLLLELTQKLHLLVIPLLPTVPRAARCCEDQACRQCPLAAWQQLATLSSWLCLSTRRRIALSYLHVPPFHHIHIHLKTLDTP